MKLIVVVLFDNFIAAFKFITFSFFFVQYHLHQIGHWLLNCYVGYICQNEGNDCIRNDGSELFKTRKKSFNKMFTKTYQPIKLTILSGDIVVVWRIENSRTIKTEVLHR